MAEGFKIADAYVEIEAELDRDRLTASVSASVSKAAPSIRRESKSRIGNSMLDGITDAFMGGLKPALTLGFSGLGGIGSAISSNPYVAAVGIALGTAVAAAALPALGTAFTAGLGLLAGAGVLGLGAFLLKDNKKLQKQLEKSFGSIFKSLEKAAQPLVKPFLAGIKTLEKALTGLEPIFTDIFKAAAPIVGLLAKQVGPTLKPILEGLKSAMPGIVAAFSGLAASLPGIGQAIGNFFSTIFQDENVIERFTKGFGDFIAFVINSAGPAIRGLTVLWGALSNVVHLFTKFLSEDLSNALAGFELFTGGAIGRIVAAWAPLKKALGDIWDALVKFANADDDLEMSKAYVTLVEKIKAAWGPLSDFVETVWDEILKAVKKWYNDKFLPWWENTAKPWLKEKIKAMATAAFEELKTMALAKAKEVPGKVVEGLKNLATDVKNDIVKQFDKAKDWLWNAGRSILQGLIDGIDSKIQSLKNLLSTVTDLIPDWKGPMSRDKKLLFPTGQAIMSGLQDGMVSRTGALESSLNKLTAAIPSMAAPAVTGGGITVNLTVNGLSDDSMPDRLVAKLYDALDRYERRHR